LLDKIKIVETDECNAGYPDGIPNKLIIKTTDGRTVEKKVTYPRGHAGNPMTDEEVIRKFKSLAGGVVSDATAERIVNTALSFHELDDVATLLEFETL
jgi:2-methylcitrate dehydratase